MGGAIALLARQGHRITLLDMTSGEPTPHGDAETRAQEAAAAARILSAPDNPVRRVLLDLPNRTLTHSIEARHKVAGVIRAVQADILFTPFFQDAHPDHIATTRIVEDARFDAKLTKIDMPAPPPQPVDQAYVQDARPGDPIYPRWLFYYYATHLRWVADPSFLIDITGLEELKRNAIVAYQTQFVIPEKNRRVVEWIDAAGRYFGSRIGTPAAEPFFTKEPLGLTDLGSVDMK
jgi:LmbE family N-acetylglucosaminyl deacetylase